PHELEREQEHDHAEEHERDQTEPQGDAGHDDREPGDAQGKVDEEVERLLPGASPDEGTEERAHVHEPTSTRSPAGSGTSVPGRSMLRRGSTRSSHRGSHQLRSPSSSMVAGTRTSRTSVASMSTATANPRPISLIARTSATTKLPNTQTMIAAAAVMTRAVDDRPCTTAERLSRVRLYSSRIDESRNTS